MPFFQRRVLMLFLSLLVTGAASAPVVPSFFASAMDPIDVVALAIFLVIMFCGSFSFWLFVFGFLLLNRRQPGKERPPATGQVENRQDQAAQPSVDPLVRFESERTPGPVSDDPVFSYDKLDGYGAGNGEVATLTAIVMPICNEDTERVYLGLQQTWLSVQQAGLAARCDVYLLCDSTEPEIQRKEEEVLQQLVEEFGGAGVTRGGEAETRRRGDNGVAQTFLSAASADSGEFPVRGASRNMVLESTVNPQAGMSALRDRRDAGPAFYLLRRKERTKFKAGNIANFLVHHGAEYGFMLVLDADSVMLGRTIKRLILRMQESPKLAILQTVVLPIRASTPFARACQFGCSRTIPLFARGQQWFYGPESVYWGHNALVRIAPFMAYCNLPIMPGKPPLGGEIMSQDIVEAALLGRAGWDVEWELDCGGSFDEMPANLLTYGRRDRRWCQGNFQHFWLVFGDGMKRGHRIYFANGIFAYAVSPLLVLLTFLAFVQGLRGRIYRSEPLMIGSFLLFFLTMLLVPRILGFVRQLRRARVRSAAAPAGGSGPTGCGAGPPTRRLHIGLGKGLFSTFLELLISSLFAPALFYLHARFVLEILTGKVAPWKGQSRNPDEALTWETAARLLWLPTVIGIIWLALAIEKTPGFVLYLLPILVGWILSIPVTVWTSRPALGAWLGRHGLLADCLSGEERSALGPLNQAVSKKHENEALPEKRHVGNYPASVAGIGQESPAVADRATGCDETL